MICQFPACKSERIYKDGLCYDHWRLCGSNPPMRTIEVKPIKNKSIKRIELDKEYLKLKKQMLSENKTCEANLTGCGKTAIDLHHISKRTERNLCDRENLLRVCRSCHTYIETHPLEAINLGVSKSKHKVSN